LHWHAELFVSFSLSIFIDSKLFPLLSDGLIEEEVQIVFRTRGEMDQRRTPEKN
jgi:hypothetical protein